MITESHFLLSIAIEQCWRPPCAHPAPRRAGSARFPSGARQPLKSALLPSFQRGLLCVFRETSTFTLLNPFTLFLKFTFEGEAVWGGRR